MDVDPDLASLVPAEDRPMARNRAAARVERLEPGPWRFQPLGHPSAFGLLVLDGLLGVRVAIGDEGHLEVLGEGDVLRPWVDTTPDASVPSQVVWEILEPTRVALLDERFAHGVAPWPQIAAALMHRMIVRVRRLSFQLALAGISRVDERVLIVLWHFADRWGSVTPRGVDLPLCLTHGQLAEVVRAARPTVSKAIGELRERGALSVERRGAVWTLHGDPPPSVEELEKYVGLER